MQSIVEIVSIVAGLMTIFGIGALVGYLPQSLKNRWLQGASIGDSPAFAKYALGVGAEPNCADSRQWSPLHHAAFAKDILTMEILLKHMASPNAECKGNNTPLYYAVSSDIEGRSTPELNVKRRNAVNLLLLNGAVVTEGIIDKAKEEGDVNIVNILERHDSEGKHPLYALKRRIVKNVLQRVEEILEEEIQHELAAVNIKG